MVQTSVRLTDVHGKKEKAPGKIIPLFWSIRFHVGKRCRHRNPFAFFSLVACSCSAFRCFLMQFPSRNVLCCSKPPMSSYPTMLKKKFTIVLWLMMWMPYHTEAVLKCTNHVLFLTTHHWHVKTPVIVQKSVQFIYQLCSRWHLLCDIGARKGSQEWLSAN